jgi:acetyl esterase/lipase
MKQFAIFMIFTIFSISCFTLKVTAIDIKDIDNDGKTGIPEAIYALKVVAEMHELHLEFSESPVDLQGISAKFVENIAYDEKKRTYFDIWLPESSRPTGLVIYIHGGGFKSGDKKGVRSSFKQEIRTFLENKIAFASINYSLLEPFGQESEGVIKSLKDSKRAIQFIKYYARSFNINKDKIMLSGGSAGAGTSLWIAFNDDLEEPNNPDPVLRESTRVSGVAVRETQATYDLERWVYDVFVDYPNITLEELLKDRENSFLQFYGLSSKDAYHTPEMINYRDRVDMLDLMSKDDPPIWVSNINNAVVYPRNTGLLYHHAYHARELKERADALGIENVISYGKEPSFFPDPVRPDETWAEFCIRILDR